MTNATVVSDRSQDLGFSGLMYQPNCDGCPFQGNKIVPPNGNLDATIAIVGDGPGRDEARIGRGFVGRAGKLLDVLLKRNGIRRADVFITSATLCVPSPAIVEVANANGSVEQIHLNLAQAKLNAMIHCRPRLLAELAHIRPKVIMPLGGLAFESVSGEWDGIQKRRGAVHQPDIVEEYRKSLVALDGPILKSKPMARRKAVKKKKRRKVMRKAIVSLVDRDDGLHAVLVCDHVVPVPNDKHKRKTMNCLTCLNSHNAEVEA